jgi:hypothetical protein
VVRAGGRALSALLSLPGHALLALDSVNRASAAASGGSAEPDSSPSGVLVSIAHWRQSTEPLGPVDTALRTDATLRMRHVLDCLRSVLELSVERVEIAISTNAPAAVAEDLAANAAAFPAETEVEIASIDATRPRSRGPGRRLIVYGWSPTLLRRPYYLTWAHKQLIRSALADPELSHFIYLEDDIKFTDSSLDYWCSFRAPLARHGLIPGFVRFEALDGSCFVVDQLERMSATALRTVSVASPGAGAEAGQTTRFVNLTNPYQGMYVLDRPLAVEHFRRSPTRDSARSRAFSNWAIRERAAIGPIFDDVPGGFTSRNVVPLLHDPGDEWRLDPRCLIEHLTGNYTRTGGGHFGSIRLEDLFNAEAQPSAAAG